MRTEDFVEDYLGIKLMWWQNIYIRMMTKILERHLLFEQIYERLILRGENYESMDTCECKFPIK